MKEQPSRKKAFLAVLPLMVACFLLPGNVLAADGTITDDATTTAQQVNKNAGDDHNLTVEQTSGNNRRVSNSYLKFNLSTLPTGVSGNDVAKATLRLWVNNLKTAGSFDVRRVIGAWNEHGITYANAPSLGSVQVAGIAVTPASEATFLTIELTGLVKDWLNGEISNDGIALVANEVISVDFDSKENEQTSHEPRLEVVLSGPAGPPGPGTVTSVSASSPLSVTNPTTTPSISLGTVLTTNGGTGLSSAGASGNLLRSNGGSWTSAPLSAADLPGGSGSYIQNTTSQQASSNFNISGNGAAGGTLSATGAVNTGAYFSISGAPVVSTPGFANTFVGAIAGGNYSAGNANSFFGTSAGANNTGNANAFFGASAGENNTTAGQNSFFGTQAGFRNTTGVGNAFFGYQTGFLNTTGPVNSFFGSGAGKSNTTGFGNSFFGAAAGTFTNADSNSFFGTNAGTYNTTGSRNSFFGFIAGQNNTTGGFNTFVGYQADFNTQNASGDYNTLVGANAQATPGLTFATAVGAFAVVTQSNSVVLGSGASVGIGTSAPKAKLHVQDGHIYVGAGGQGIILKSPDGATCRLLTIDNAGAMALSPIACP